MFQIFQMSRQIKNMFNINYNKNSLDFFFDFIFIVFVSQSFKKKASL